MTKAAMAAARFCVHQPLQASAAGDVVAHRTNEALSDQHGIAAPSDLHGLVARSGEVGDVDRSSLRGDPLSEVNHCHHTQRDWSVFSQSVEPTALCAHDGTADRGKDTDTRVGKCIQQSTRGSAVKSK
ncbi:hypothetical protein GCM10009619_41340 [Williamsia maris]